MVPSNVAILAMDESFIFSLLESTSSSVLDDYEGGTWTPTDGSGASLSLTTSTCY